jgi:hypothetical protein
MVFTVDPEARPAMVAQLAQEMQMHLPPSPGNCIGLPFE